MESEAALGSPDGQSRDSPPGRALTVEFALAVWAFRRGWRWRALLPVGITFAAGFVIGMVAVAGGGSADAARPLAAVMDIVMIVVLAIMCSRRPVVRETSSPIRTREVATDPAAVHVFAQNASEDRAAAI